uniref:Agmatinase n=1 Tax=Tanacetum cinerariifolium TaxID=118510 RepID=A0A699GG34_TANCI|nr:hypothetical protein [Tanacetum cinerariifolium]
MLPKEISQLTGISPSLQLRRGESSESRVIPRHNIWALDSTIESCDVAEHWETLRPALNQARDDLRVIAKGGKAKFSIVVESALARRYPRLGVLQFDAHPDLYAVGAACDEQLNHANVMHRVRRMAHVKALWQVGVRDFFHQPTDGVAAVRDTKVHKLSAFEAETSGYQRLLDGMDPTLPWFITFDVDALAVAELPQTATPVLGGLSFYPLLACFERLFRDFQIVGMEFVEIGDSIPGAHGPAAIAARLASRYLFHLRNASSTPGLLYAPGK